MHAKSLYWAHESGEIIRGPHPRMTGDTSRLYGDCSGIWGHCTGASGDCTDVEGDCSTQSGSTWVLFLEEPVSSEEKATERQVGGDHYKNLAIQPVEYITANNLTFLEGNVVKYITRHSSKNGRADVEKAIHYCQLILELQYK
jgi:hypothetical protein